MDLSKRQINNLKGLAGYYKLKRKGSLYYFSRGLIGVFIFQAFISILGVFTGLNEVASHLVIALILFIGYSLLFYLIWGYIEFQGWLGKRVKNKAGLNMRELERIVEANSTDFATILEEGLREAYPEIEGFHELPEFRIPERPTVYGKIGSWLGWGELDKEQKKEKRSMKLYIIFFGALLLSLGIIGGGETAAVSIIFGGAVIVYGLLWKSKHSKGKDSLAIYQGLLHYWNTSFIHTDYRTRETLNNSFTKQLLFDASDDEKVKIKRCYEAIHPIEQTLTDDIAYVFKQNKNVYKEETKGIGVLYKLAIPSIQKGMDTDTNVSNNFYLVPSGHGSKKTFYDYHSTVEAYDVYTAGEPSQEELNQVLKLIRPLTERNWDVAVEYSSNLMSIYLPEFLPDIENITTEAELLKVCRRVDSIYSFLKRTFIWRYGNIEKWNEREGT
ncbi:hypothetical protein [Virgibacillus ainsalahensis]